MAGVFAIAIKKPAPSYVFQDELTNNDWWDEDDPSGVGSFTPGGYEKDGYAAYVLLESNSSKFRIKDDWEIILDVDIDTITGSPDDDGNVILDVTQNAGKASASGGIELKGNSDGTLNAASVNTWTAGFTAGSYRLRIKRTASDELTYWIWTGSQWEWNGNTNGVTTSSGGAWGSSTEVYITISMGDESVGNMVDSTITQFTLVTGTFVDLT